MIFDSTGNARSEGYHTVTHKPNLCPLTPLITIPGKVGFLYRLNRASSVSERLVVIIIYSFQMVIIVFIKTSIYLANCDNWQNASEVYIFYTQHEINT